MNLALCARRCALGPLMKGIWDGVIVTPDVDGRRDRGYHRGYAGCVRVRCPGKPPPDSGQHSADDPSADSQRPFRIAAQYGAGADRYRAARERTDTPDAAAARHTPPRPG